MRSSLTEDLVKTVAQAIVRSCLDYCNSLWLGMSESNFDQGFKTLARVITGHTKFDRITPVLAKLNWLPVRSRVTFKVPTLNYKVRQSGQHSYLSSLVPPYVPAHQLRSSSKALLTSDNMRTRIGARAFKNSAATL